ncbi:cytochrome P450 [Paraphoma chrysanthemicola]|uniref:Cytochrome P450 n=1 Tax=Paraphoma chrysanthemicola TaxID=798071 RepID=A0A8K0RC94_9PLEO|nr:cytochrome P450 [Paraphoma chrysanthemicola]
MSFPVFLYSSSFIVLIWLVARALLLPKPIPGVPYSRLSYCMPWGELIDLGIYTWRTGEVFSWLSMQCLKHKSPLVQLFIPPFSTTHPTLVLADLPEIEDIVTKRIAEIDRADLMHTWFGLLVPRATIGFKSKDAHFKQQRRLWNVILSPKFLDEVAAPCFVEVANKLAELWEKKAELAGSKYAFEALADIKHATLDGVWKMCCATELGLLDATISRLRAPAALKVRGHGVVEFAKCEMPKFYDSLGTMLVCLDWVMQGISPRMYTWIFRITGILPRAEKEKDAVLDRCIELSRSRINRKTEGLQCALDQVLLKDLQLNEGPTPEEDTDREATMRDELLELLITGHETTASSIAWALKYLADNPDVQTQLRASLQSALPKALPSAKDIVTTSMPYLDAVIAETLRISATGPVSFRQTLVPCGILGCAIPAGTPIILVTAGPSYERLDMPTVPLALRSKASQATLERKETLPLSSQSPLYDLSTFAPERWLVEGQFDPNALDFPQLAGRLGRYGARDGLTRRPTSCYVSPRPASWK